MVVVVVLTPNRSDGIPVSESAAKTTPEHANANDIAQAILVRKVWNVDAIRNFPCWIMELYVRMFNIGAASRLGIRDAKSGLQMVSSLTLRVRIPRTEQI